MMRKVGAAGPRTIVYPANIGRPFPSI